MKEKTKFIILADARTGSHILQTALNQHSQINCCGEILNPKSKDSLLENSFPLDAVQQVFNSNKPCNGFIINRSRKGLDVIWDYLSANDDIRVIITDRYDQIKRYASLKIAEKTNKYIDLGGYCKSDVKIHFIKHEFINAINTYKENLVKCKNKFDSHPGLIIIYEHLIADYKKTIMTVCKFLHVKYEPVTPLTFQQETRELNEIFINYEDIGRQPLA